MKHMLKGLKSKYDGVAEPVKASFWYTICNVLNKAIALLSTPIFTRILSEEEYGAFSIFQSWYSIIVIFTSLNISMNCYAKGLIKYRNDEKAFTSSLLGLTTVMTCGYGLIYLCNIPFWTIVFEISPILMLAMFLELLFAPAMELWAAGERFNYKYKKFMFITIGRTVLSVVGGVIAILNTSYKVEARVFTDVFSKVLFAAIMFGIIFVSGKKFYNKKYWIYALKFNIPLIPHYLSNYILSQSDRLMIGRMVSNSAAAYYSVAYNISTMMKLVMTAINNTLTPYIYKTIDAEGKRAEIKIKKATTPIFVLVAILSVMAMIFAPEIILIFAGRNYMDAIYVIPPISASVYFIFVYSMFGTIEYYYEKTGFIAIATGVSAVLNVVLNYIFIDMFGYYAAGYTTVVCYICLTIMHYIFYKKILKSEMSEVNNLYDMRFIVLISGGVLVMMGLMVCVYDKIIIRYGLFLILSVCMFMYRKKIIQVLKKKND